MFGSLWPMFPHAQGFHLKTSTRPDLLARLARGDVNMPGFDGFPIEKQVPETLFEAAVYRLLRSEPDIRASYLLYYRPPKQSPGPTPSIPRNLNGRRLFVFERAAGCNNVWDGLNSKGKVRRMSFTSFLLSSTFLTVPSSISSISWLISARLCSATILRSTSRPDIFTIAFSVSSQTPSICLLLLRANFGFMCWNQKSRQQSGTKAIWLVGRMTRKRWGLLLWERSILSYARSPW